MANVYLVERGQLNLSENKFNFYDKEFFTSRKKAEESVAESIEINKGYSVAKANWLGRVDTTEWTYNCKCTEGREVSLRITLTKYEVK